MSCVICSGTRTNSFNACWCFWTGWAHTEHYRPFRINNCCSRKPASWTINNTRLEFTARTQKMVTTIFLRVMEDPVLLITYSRAWNLWKIHYFFLFSTLHYYLIKQNKQKNPHLFSRIFHNLKMYFNSRPCDCYILQCILWTRDVLIYFSHGSVSNIGCRFYSLC